MKGSVVALGAWRGRAAVARLVDGRLEDLLVDPGGDAPLPGAIFRAVADRPMKGQGGVTVKLPGGARGFLRQTRGLRPGQALLVQVSTHAEPGKAVPVSTRLIFKSRFAIVTPGAPGVNVSRRVRDAALRDRLAGAVAGLVPEGAGLILRSAAAEAGEDAVIADAAAMCELARDVTAEAAGGPELLLDGPDAHLLAWRDWPEPELVAEGAGAFAEHEVEERIEAMLRPRVDLSGGAYAFVEPTRALVAVDVNTGGDTSPAAGLKANLALVRDLPRQLRCRGLGGQVTVDFAPFAKRERRQLETALGAAFRADPIETALAGWTPLGHFELQRKRERAPLAEG
ncbi:ribonuclease E/G [Psychromarinibacter sp. C21-152]|uniref:Ribonuclease E/G n=1 Tax=Psychromarinibacter sediminicola TaxID=3033385 RepID=A0AAE3NTH0_9RHOB|nr:ribonuclease E/G [Psychromarinibacter sediminicola]MDF0602121.1 ribonuclease E/G [Psychromarinibacter sediminicola]